MQRVDYGGHSAEQSFKSGDLVWFFVPTADKLGGGLDSEECEIISHGGDSLWSNTQKWYTPTAFINAEVKSQLARTLYMACKLRNISAVSSKESRDEI